MIGTEEAWALAELPETMAVVGAGASGAEIASGYARLGVEVLLFEALDRVLPTEDADISKVAERGLKTQGIDDPHRARSCRTSSRATTASRSRYGEAAGEVDWLVIAAGRGPDVEALGLEAAGVKLDDSGLIEVDGAMRTSADGRLRDRRPRPRPGARAQGVRRGRDRRRGRRRARAPTRSSTSTSRARRSARPNVASFGLTEAQAREQGHDVVVGKVQYGAVGAGTVYGDRTGLVKIVGEKKYGELLGGHIVGAKATELIQELVNVRAARGRLSRDRAHHPRPPDAVRGGHGGRPRRRRLADPRLRSVRQCAAAPTQPVFYYDLGSPALLPASPSGSCRRCRWCPSGSRCSAPSSALQSSPSPTAPRSSARADELGLQPLRWPRRWPPGHAHRDARRDVRQAGRPRGRVLAGGVPPGVRRRARPRRRGHGADRGRRLRDAPDRGAEGDRAAVGDRRARAGAGARARAAGVRPLPAIAGRRARVRRDRCDRGGRARCAERPR